jgi:hypothetical protein
MKPTDFAPDDIVGTDRPPRCVPLISKRYSTSFEEMENRTILFPWRQVPVPELLVSLIRNVLSGQLQRRFFRHFSDWHGGTAGRGFLLIFCAMRLIRFLYCKNHSQNGFYIVKTALSNLTLIMRLSAGIGIYTVLRVGPQSKNILENRRKRMDTEVLQASSIIPDLCQA